MKSSTVMNSHELPDLPERSKFGSRLVRHTVAVTLATVALLVVTLVVVLMVVSAEYAIALPDRQRPARIEHELGGATGRGIRVAVIDSGRDPAWSDPRIKPGIGLTDSGDGLELVRSQDDLDRIGHGTACSDIILGMAPAVEILPVRVFGSRLETSPEVIVAAIEWAVDEGVEVINLSLGCLLERALRPLYQACEQAREVGVVLVSAIHLGEGWSYPAIFENTIGVTAGRFANIFDFEYSPDEGAECRAQGERQVRWLGERRRVYGSSFAAPHISAMIAFLLERFPGSDLDQIRRFLARLAVPQRAKVAQRNP